MTKQAGKEIVCEFIDEFEKGESQYMLKYFQETEIRTGFGIYFIPYWSDIFSPVSCKI